MIASSPTSAALLRADPTHSPAKAFPGCSQHYSPTAAACRQNNNNLSTTSPLISNSNPLHSPRPSRPRRRSSDSHGSSGVEEIQSAFRRQTVDAGTQYSRPATPANNKLNHSAPTAAGETISAESTNATSELPTSQQSQEGVQSLTDPQMPSTLVGSKRNITAPSNLLATDGEKLQSIGPDNRAESLSKRLRPENPAVKVLPCRYEEANPRDLVVLISSMLMELIRFNDQIPLRDGRLTRFHSRSPPRISVHDYLQRLTTHATLSPPILLSMVYYIDRLCALYPAFTVSSLTVHRFLISSATVASKGLSDSFWTNKTYARVGGISIAELALLELEFLWRVEWRIVPQPEVLEDYYQRLVERCDEYVIQPGKDSDAQPTEKDETVATSSAMRNRGSTSATDATATTTANTK
ncbi:cyclin-dependent protein kinase regulator Pho80 [Histoplasma ohiense]|nr:cyclin-dependent protein kinase regulator Pho80 [Histoplasma ohiense (nom. inval.)]